MNVRQLIRYVDRYFEVYFAIAILTVYTAIIIGDTLRRIILGRQTLWGHEIVIAMFIWMSWISAAYVIRWNGHLRFSFFMKDFNNKRKGIVAITESVIWIVFAAIVVWYSLSVMEVFAAAGRTFSGTNIPSVLAYLSIPVCFSLIVVRALQQLVLSILKFRSGEEFTFKMEEVS